MEKLYSRILLEDGHHVTLEFNPGNCTIPSPLKEGQRVQVIQTGYYSDQDIDADIVSIYDIMGNELLKFQSDKQTPLHITRECRNGTSPVEAGIRARGYGYIFDFAAKPLRISYGTVGYCTVEILQGERND